MRSQRSGAGPAILAFRVVGIGLSLHRIKMAIEAFIGFGYELAIKPFLADTGFVASCQKDRLAIMAECEEDAPDATIGIAP